MVASDRGATTGRITWEEMTTHRHELAMAEGFEPKTERKNQSGCRQSLRFFGDC